MKWWKDHIIVTPETDGSGFIEILPEWIDLPDSDMAAREVNDTHVKDLVESYSRIGVAQLEGQVKILFFHHHLVAAGLNPQELRLKPYLESGVKPCKMVAVVGAHRSRAIQKLRLLKPNNIKYKRLKVQAAVCHDSDHSRLKALTFGTLENTIQAVRLKADAWDYIAQIHRYYDSLKQKFEDRFPDHTDCADALTAYKKTVRATMKGFTQATLGNFFAIANTWGKLWKNISTVMINDRNKVNLTGTGKKSKAKTTKKLGHSWLCDMSKIPEDQLIAWSDEVVREEITPAEFKARCNMWKKHIKVQDFVVDWYNIEYQDDRDFEEVDTYSELAEKYPFLQDEDFFEQMLMHYPTSGKVEILPSGIADVLRQKIRGTTAVKR